MGINTFPAATFSISSGYQPGTSTTLDDFQMVNDADGVVTRNVTIPAGSYSAICTITSTLTIGLVTYAMTANVARRIIVPTAASSYTLNANGYLNGFQMRDTTLTVSNTNAGTINEIGNYWTMRKNIAYGGSSNLFLVVPGYANGGGTTYYTSPDGVTWTTRTFPAAQQFVQFVGSYFYACNSNATMGSGTMLTSTDGITWTSRTFAGNRRFAFPAKGSGTKYATVEIAYPTSGNQFQATLTSTDGLTWVTGGNLPTTATWIGIASDGTTDKMVTVAYRDGSVDTATATTKAAYSTNAGASWTAATLPSTQQWATLIWSNNLYYAFSSSNAGGYATSPDGITWTARTYPETNLGTTLFPIWVGTNGLGTGLFACNNNSNTSITHFTSNGINWTTSTAAKNVVYGVTSGTQSIVYGNNIHMGTQNFRAATDTSSPAMSTANAPIVFGIYNPPTTTL
jgi:hypothetical protein